MAVHYHLGRMLVPLFMWQNGVIQRPPSNYPLFPGVTEYCRRTGGILMRAGAIQGHLKSTKCRFVSHKTIRGDFMSHKEGLP